MMRQNLAALTIALSAPALAASSTTPAFVDNSGIITPEIAVGMQRYDTFTADVNGRMVVCVDYVRSECRSGWKEITTILPAGRKYVGFRVVSGHYGYRQLEVYWK